MELYGLSKYDWLSTFLELPNGIPSPDTFRRVFEKIQHDVDETGGVGGSMEDTHDAPGRGRSDKVRVGHRNIAPVGQVHGERHERIRVNQFPKLFNCHAGFLPHASVPCKPDGSGASEPIHQRHAHPRSHHTGERAVRPFLRSHHEHRQPLRRPGDGEPARREGFPGILSMENGLRHTLRKCFMITPSY